MHDRTGSIRKASSWSRNLPDQFPRFEKHFPRWKEQTGGFKVVSLLDDLKDTCTVHQKYKQLDFYNSYGERGFPTYCSIIFTFFYCNLFLDRGLSQYTFRCMRHLLALVGWGLARVLCSVTFSKYAPCRVWCRGHRVCLNPLSGSFRWSSKLSGVLFEQIE